MESIPPIPDDKVFFENVVYVVEATSDEYHFLWREYAQNRLGFDWDDRLGPNSALMIQIGSLDNRPVNIMVRKARLLGRVVVFWEMTSQVQDYKMAREWLGEVSEAYREGHEYNVANFSHCVNHLCKLNGKNPRDYPRIWDHVRKKLITPIPPRKTSSSQVMRAVTEHKE